MSARATAMAVMLIVIAPITTIATPMGMARGGGTVTVIGTSEHQFRLAKLSPFGSRAGRRVFETSLYIRTYRICSALSHLLRKLGWADDATMKSGSGLAPALFVCCPFV